MRPHQIHNLANRLRRIPRRLREIEREMSAKCREAEAANREPELYALFAQRNRLNTRFVELGGARP